MKKFLILVLSAALLLAFFGCGSPKEDESKNDGPPPGTEDFDEIYLEPLPTPADSDKATTGENNSKMYKFTGENFTKIKDALPGSYLSIKYTSTVNYAVGEIGWKSISDAGPVIIGDATNKNQTAIVYREDLVIGDADFTIHMFNPSTLKEVVLYSAPEGYTPTPNPNATAGGQKIFIPSGHPVPGNGDLSKADFAKITKAASGTLVFYFEKNTAPSDGILKFGPKSGDPYKHYGISKDGAAIDGNDGWRAYTAGEEEGKGTITYTVAEIKAGLAFAATDFPSGKFNKLEINQGSTAKADLVYIELKP